MSTSAFAKAFQNKAQKIFNKAKGHKHRTGHSFGPVDVPDGSFSAVVTLETGVPAKGKMAGIPVVRAKAAITTGDHAGKEPSQSYFCEGKMPSDDPEAMPTAEQQLLGLLGFLLPDCEVTEIEQVEAAIEEVNRRGPLCIVGIRNTAKNGKKYQNVYFNKLVEAATFEQEESGDAADATSAEEETPVESDEPEAEAPVKGDTVLIEGEQGEFEVARVYQSRQTADCVSKADGTKKSGIAWSDLSIV